MKKAIFIFLFFLSCTTVWPDQWWCTVSTDFANRVFTDGFVDGSTCALNFSYLYTVNSNPGGLGYRPSITLYTENAQYDNVNIPQWFYRNAGTYNWHLHLIVLDALGETVVCTGDCYFTFTVKYNIRFSNNIDGGIITVDNNTNANVPVWVPKSIGDTVRATAINQSYNNNYYKWDNNSYAHSCWLGKKMNDPNYSPTSYSQNNLTYIIADGDAGARFLTDLRMITKLVPTNNVGTGTFTVGGVQHNAGDSVEVFKYDQVSITALTGCALSNSLYANFAKWNDGTTTLTTTVTPTTNTHQATGITAYYKLQPTDDYRGLMFNSTVGDPVTLYWNQHPNASVTSYKIYRKHYGDTTQTLLATISRANVSSYTYVDNDYCISSDNSHNNMLFYDVRAVYSGTLPDNTNYTTTADMYYQSVFGTPNNASVNKNEDNKIIASSNSLVPKDYKIGNFPNPFNPSTIIQYSLPEECNVLLKVYNILGQEVATLVNETKGAGIYQASFNAAHLPSGIYIARLQAGSKVMITKLQYMK